MFSAVKLVTATAVVTLFGGYLLAGTLQQGPAQPIPPAAATVAPSEQPAPFASVTDLDRYFDEGILGPRDQRQRVEVPAHGFALSIADDWTVEIPLPDPQEDERLGMHALLRIDPDEEGAACSVYVAPGAAPLVPSADAERIDGEVLSDSAARLLGPWFEEQGLLGDGWGWTVGDSWGAKAGFNFADASGSTSAVWVVPDSEDLYVLACTWTAGPDYESRPEFLSRPHQMMLALEPMAESFEFLPAEKQAARERRCPTCRYQLSSGVAMSSGRPPSVTYQRPTPGAL